MTRSETASLLDFAYRTAIAAGPGILSHFRQPISIDNKGGTDLYDPVTEADRAAETVIRRAIATAYPGHGIRGEEQGWQRGTTPYTWVIDPIDGTRSFILGQMHWATLIALNDGEGVVVGVAHQPYVGESFLGFAGGQALWRRDGAQRSLHTRRCASIRDAVVACTDPAMFREPSELAAFQRVAAEARLTRYGGDCYAYCMVAAGHVDLVIETELKPHDVMALVPIVQGAGGIMTTWENGPPQHGGRIVAAGDRRVHAQALQLLNR